MLSKVKSIKDFLNNTSYKKCIREIKIIFSIILINICVLLFVFVDNNRESMSIVKNFIKEETLTMGIESDEVNSIISSSNNPNKVLDNFMEYRVSILNNSNINKISDVGDILDFYHKYDKYKNNESLSYYSKMIILDCILTDSYMTADRDADNYEELLNNIYYQYYIDVNNISNNAAISNYFYLTIAFTIVGISFIFREIFILMELREEGR